MSSPVLCLDDVGSPGPGDVGSPCPGDLGSLDDQKSFDEEIYAARVALIEAAWKFEHRANQIIYSKDALSMWFGSRALRLTLEEFDLPEHATEEDFVAQCALP